MTADELQRIIAEKAAKPASMQNDMGQVTQRPLGEMIEAHRYLQSQEAAQQPTLGLRFNKIVAPGA